MLILVLLCLTVSAEDRSASQDVENAYSDVLPLYLDIHQNPELSGHETRTAAKLATRLRELGYEVTEHIGNTGIIALMKNGYGPTVMLRTELDALPVEEQTGLQICEQGARKR